MHARIRPVIYGNLTGDEGFVSELYAENGEKESARRTHRRNHDSYSYRIDAIRPSIRPSVHRAFALCTLSRDYGR